MVERKKINQGVRNGRGTKKRKEQVYHMSFLEFVVVQ